MKKTLFVIIPLVCILLFISPLNTFAQSYYFAVDKLVANVYWNNDGTTSIDYVFVFSNQPGAHPIDYVDVGLPTSNFDEYSITADINGITITNISRSGYEGSGYGVAVGLGDYAIQPGQTGTVHVFIGTVKNVIYPDSKDKDYVSAVFSTTWFGSEYVTGITNTTVTFHFPQGVQPDEPRWHTPAKGFPSEPAAGFDSDGRITYTWNNPQATADQAYKFGASFPAKYVPKDTVVHPSIWQILGITYDTFMNCICCASFIGFAGFWIFAIYRKTRKRRMQYLPPKITVEGHGIKRGLTAIEAAVLLEQPMDKILTMILFSTIKKGAAKVTSKEPLKVEVVDPLPENLRPYEKQFLEAMKKSKPSGRRRVLQETMIDLVHSVSKKMKGFSYKETVAYYESIVKRAWTQVETAQTPEVKSEKYDKVMEWTMLDDDYEDRTKDIFRSGPVIMPTWWSRYDPTIGHSTPSPSSRPSAPASTPTPGGVGVPLPTLPGAMFAASIANGVQDFSSSVVGNLTNFTEGITNKTNPIPASSGFSSSGGSSGCACACACAGCACACAGGGR